MVVCSGRLVYFRLFQSRLYWRYCCSYIKQTAPLLLACQFTPASNPCIFPWLFQSPLCQWAYFSIRQTGLRVNPSGVCGCKDRNLSVPAKTFIPLFLFLHLFLAVFRTFYATFAISTLHYNRLQNQNFGNWHGLSAGKALRTGSFDSAIYNMYGILLMSYQREKDFKHWIYYGVTERMEQADTGLSSYRTQGILQFYLNRTAVLLKSD